MKTVDDAMALARKAAAFQSANGLQDMSPAAAWSALESAVTALVAEMDAYKAANLAMQSQSAEYKAERDALRTNLDDWLYANGPNGWIDALRVDAERWRLFIRTAGLGFDGAPSWNAVIRLPVFDAEDQTITALVDRVAIDAARSQP